VRFFRLIPDWLVYAILLLIILVNVMGRADQRSAPTPPPKLGPALPNVHPADPNVIVEIPSPRSGTGTAFSIGGGRWLTARHVVDRCDEVGLHMGGSQYVKVDKIDVSTNSDTALLRSQWTRPSLARDLNAQRQIGESGFFIGFPQGKPGEVAGSLLGRHKMVVRGRYRTSEPILAWAEISRTRGLKGSLGGLSGGPAFDIDGEVIGIVAAESPRRGRVYTVAPASLLPIFNQPSTPAKAEPISITNYGRRADRLRRNRRIAQVVCLVR